MDFLAYSFHRYPLNQHLSLLSINVMSKSIAMRSNVARCFCETGPVPCTLPTVELLHGLDSLWKIQRHDYGLSMDITGIVIF